jgi:hypothetical protein
MEMAEPVLSRPTAAVCRGCSYWLERLVDGGRCPECGGLTESSASGDWVGGASVEEVLALARWGRVVGLAMVGMIAGVLAMMAVAGLLRGDKAVSAMGTLVIGGAGVYLWGQMRARRRMLRINPRGGSWLTISGIAAIPVALWVVFAGAIMASIAAGKSPSAGRDEVFNNVSLWVAMPALTVMIGAGGIGLWKWAPALGDDQWAIRRMGLVVGVAGGGGYLVAWAAIVTEDWIMRRRWTAVGPNPQVQTVLDYTQFIGGVAMLSGAVAIIVSGVAMLMVERRCRWVVKERGKAEGATRGA